MSRTKRGPDGRRRQSQVARREARRGLLELLENRRLMAGDLSVGGDTLLLDWSAMAYTVPLGAHGFRDCQLLATQAATHWGAPLASFRFYACRGWSGRPQPRLRTE